MSLAILYAATAEEATTFDEIKSLDVAEYAMSVEAMDIQIAHIAALLSLLDSNEEVASGSSHGASLSAPHRRTGSARSR